MLMTQVLAELYDCLPAIEDPVVDSPMLSRILARSDGGIISRSTSSTSCTIFSVISSRVPDGARTCRRK